MVACATPFAFLKRNKFSTFFGINFIDMIDILYGLFNNKRFHEIDQANLAW